MGGIEHAVELTVGHWTERIHNRRPELLKGPHCLFAGSRRATMTGHHHSQHCARPVRSVDEPAEDRMLIRQRGRAVAEEPQQVTCAVKGVRDQTARYRGSY